MLTRNGLVCRTVVFLALIVQWSGAPRSPFGGLHQHTHINGDVEGFLVPILSVILNYLTLMKPKVFMVFEFLI
jgi:hypothetical protein